MDESEINRPFINKSYTQDHDLISNFHGYIDIPSKKQTFSGTDFSEIQSKLETEIRKHDPLEWHLIDLPNSDTFPRIVWKKEMKDNQGCSAIITLVSQRQKPKDFW